MEAVNITGLIVREIDASEFPSWDRFVDESKNGTIFHCSDWIKVYSDHFGYPFCIIGCYHKNELVGGCSLFLNKSKIWKRSYSTSELMPYGGIVVGKGKNDSVRGILLWEHEIISAINNFLDLKKFRNIDIVCSPGFTDIRSFTWIGWRNEVHFVYYLESGASVGSFPKSVRRDIKNAYKRGVQVERRFDPKVHYDLYKKVFNRQNLQPPVKSDFFEKVFAKFSTMDRVVMFIGKTPDDVPISTLIVLADKKMAYLWSGFSDPGFIDYDSFLLLFLESMTMFKNRGYNNIDMMSGNVFRLSKFATRFNPILVPYYRVFKNDTIYTIASSFRSLFPNE